MSSKVANGAPEPILRLVTDPLYGWDWVNQHQKDSYPDPTIVLCVDGRRIATIKSRAKPGAVKQIMASVRG